MKKLSICLISLLFSGCAAPVFKHERVQSPSPKKSSSNRGAPATPRPSSPGVTSSPLIVSPQPPGSDLLQRARENEQSAKYLEALRDYLNLSVSAQAPQQQESYRIKALDLLETRLNEEELKQVGNSSDYGFLRGHALFQLGQISVDRRDTDSARRYFSSVISYLPGTDLAVRAKETLSQLESMKYVEPKTIGVVLPLSGKNSVVGQKALRSIELGLGLHEGSSNFKLAVMDSEGNPDTARRGVERLVKEDNVMAIIGSLLSRTAPAVAAKADELGVPTIGLSQKAGLTEIGPTVFRNAVTSEMQVREIVRTAMDEMGMRRFAILFPNDPYGIEFANIFWDEVLARGGSITAAQPYSPKDTDFRAVSQRLVSTWYVEAREAEFKALSKNLAKDTSKKKSIRQEKSADDILPPIVDFEAVFIPDSAKMMTQMAAFLSYVGLRNVKLLGTNLWNTPGIGKKAGLFADRLVFVDTVPLDSEAAKASRFVTDYQTLFRETPSLLELQAYDSALILRNLISQGAGSREDLTRRLTDLKRFPGALGFLSMGSAREIRRPLMTYMTNAAGATVPYRRNNLN